MNIYLYFFISFFAASNVFANGFAMRCPQGVLFTADTSIPTKPEDWNLEYKGTVLEKDKYTEIKVDDYNMIYDITIQNIKFRFSGCGRAHGNPWFTVRVPGEATRVGDCACYLKEFEPSTDSGI